MKAKLKGIPSENLVPGKLYRMVSHRFGTAIVECVQPSDEGGEFIVREGRLAGIRAVWEPGDEFIAVNHLQDFFEIESAVSNG